MIIIEIAYVQLIYEGLAQVDLCMSIEQPQPCCTEALFSYFYCIEIPFVGFLLSPFFFYM